MLRLIYILKLNPYDCCTVFPGIAFLFFGTMIVFSALMAWYFVFKLAEKMEIIDNKAVARLFIHKCSINVLNLYSWIAILMITYMSAVKAGDLYFLPDLFAIAFFSRLLACVASALLYTEVRMF